jgi:hypothetical protein
MTTGYHHPEEGHVDGPLDNRDSDENFEVDSYFSCTNTDFGGTDPAEEPEDEAVLFDVRGDEA